MIKISVIQHTCFELYVEKVSCVFNPTNENRVWV